MGATPRRVAKAWGTAGALLLSIAALTAQQPASPPGGAETRDRYLNPRETDLSLALEIDPSEVPEVPPVEPADVLDTFRIEPGFRIELVAHEPLVVDPVQIAFDERGRLYVVEMRWYQSEMRSDLMFDERIGRVRLLEDTTGDGRFDRSTVFADRLRYPSAIFPYDGGVFVGVEPDILFMKDTTGDGVADRREVVFTGFGNQRDRLDSQMFLNSLAWGLDNRIHGARGHGGTIRHAAADAPPLDLRGRDFSFDPRTLVLRAESGGGKQGRSFDDYGRTFASTQSSPVLLMMYEDRYAGRNPHYAPPRPTVDIALAGDESADRQPVGRISQEDPWRRIRNRWRAEGIFAGPPPQPAGYITAATGVTIYRGDAFPAAYRGSAFVGASANNLVHRRVVDPHGVELRARRTGSDAEFLVSTDIWFRPVAFANGPDGALYVADLYREIIDFSDGVPESIKRFKDLNLGNDRGRIYRIVPEAFRPPAPLDLGRASTADLVQTLAHPNAWHRETAARLLYTRQDKSAIPALVRLVEASPSPLGRLHALYALDGLGALAEPYVLTAMSDSDAGMREHGVRLAERLVAAGTVSDALWSGLKAAAADPAARVRYQLAFTLGEVDRPERFDLLAGLALRDIDERWVRTAALTSLSDGAGELFQHVATRSGDTPSGQTFLADLLRMIGHRNRGPELLAAFRFLETVTKPATTFALANALADGLQRADVPLALFGSWLQPVIDRARTAAADPGAPDAVRVQAVGLVALAEATADTIATLLSLVSPDQPRAVQTAAIAAVARLDDPTVGTGLIERWPRLTPSLRREVLPLLLARPDRALALVSAVERGAVPGNELTPTQVAFLRAHRNEEVRGAAASVFAAPAANRQAAITRYLGALDLDGNPARGHAVYRERCASCHRHGTEGYALGPDVSAMRTATREELLTHTLDPNRTVDARYRLYLLETTDGTTVTGLIEQETDQLVTLRQPFGAGDTRLRSSIARLEALEQSMMPEGLEEGLSVQDMADLLAFLVSGER
jgi:putative membrane-bound dehydrogenase-like protein